MKVFWKAFSKSLSGSLWRLLPIFLCYVAVWNLFHPVVENVVTYMLINIITIFLSGMMLGQRFERWLRGKHEAQNNL